VTATGLDADGVYGDSKRPTPVLSATDTVSGGATATATLDGKTLTSGRPLELWRLPLGSHDLTITARDRAGNTTTKTVSFTTRTSYADIRSLITQLRADGLITAQGQQRLTVRLDQAQAHADAGRASQAAAVLESFAGYAADATLVPDSAAGAALARDARALKGGTTG
jgi:hypothetical protein